MQINLEIDDSVLKDAVENGIANVDEQTISGIVKEAINEYLTKENVIERIVFKTDVNGWKTYQVLNPCIEEILKRSFSEEEIKEYKELIFKTLKNKGPDLVLRALGIAFTKQLITDDFQRTLADQFFNTQSWVNERLSNHNL